MSLLAKQYEEKVKNKKGTEVSEYKNDVLYPTGYPNFDCLCGYSSQITLPDGTEHIQHNLGFHNGVIFLIGRSNSGKTTFAIQSAANIVAPFVNSKVYYDDVEGGAVEERIFSLSQMSETMFREKFMIRNTGVTAESFHDRLIAVAHERIENQEQYMYDTGKYNIFGDRIFRTEPTVYILDSLAILMPEKFSEDEEVAGSMYSSAAAKVNSYIFKKIVPIIRAANIILLVVNHINPKIDINPMQRTRAQLRYLKPNETLPGGERAIFLSNAIVRFTDHSKLNAAKDFGIDGALVDTELLKSRTAAAGISSTLVLDFKNGFDRNLSLLQDMKNRGYVKTSGAYMYIEGYNDDKFYQKNFRTKMENKEFEKRFYTAAWGMMQEMLGPPIKPERGTRDDTSFNDLMGMAGQSQFGSSK
jgi:RecA/RadA recombinase